jgi:hypothetical protein
VIEMPRNHIVRVQKVSGPWSVARFPLNRAAADETHRWNVLETRLESGPGLAWLSLQLQILIVYRHEPFSQFLCEY